MSRGYKKSPLMSYCLNVHLLCFEIKFKRQLGFDRWGVSAGKRRRVQMHSKQARMVLQVYRLISCYDVFRGLRSFQYESHGLRAMNARVQRQEGSMHEVPGSQPLSQSPS